MFNLPDPIKKLANRLSELPSIGPRQAIRLAFHLISQGQNDIDGLAADIDGLKKIKTCGRCFFVHQNAGPLCNICADQKRNHKLIAIVEKETDLISLENSRRFNGRYLVLGPISKIGTLNDAQKLKIQNLKGFIEKEIGGYAEEILLAFNPTSSGDFHTSLITKELSTLTKKITRLGRGLPTGGEIEFADDDTLGAALERRN